MEYRMKWGSDGQKSRPPVSMRVLLQVWEKALALLVSLFFPLTVLQRGEALAHGHGVLERSKVSNMTPVPTFSLNIRLPCTPFLSEHKFMLNAAKNLSYVPVYHKYFLSSYQLDFICFPAALSNHTGSRMFSFLILGPLCLVPFQKSPFCSLFVSG